MFFPENDIQSWKNDLKEYDLKRKTFQIERVEKPVQITHKDVKLKDIQYHPILQVYADKNKVYFLRLMQ
jgi:hypothetical protein